MTLQQILLKYFNLKENIDYNIVNQEIQPIRKERIINAVIEHPAVLNENNEIVTPAWNEVAEDIENFFEVIPTTDQINDCYLKERWNVLKPELIDLVQKYIKNNNKELHFSQDEFEWPNIKNIHWQHDSVLIKPTIDELELVKENWNNEKLEEKRISEIKEKGKRDRIKCENVLDLIAGFNRNRSLTIEQITQMQTVFSNAEKALRSSRPDFAASYINAIVPDGVLITTEMKTLALKELQS